jgi:hypothetical protein
MGEKRETFCIWGGGDIILLLEGSQAVPARLSDKDRMKVKTLEW